MSAPVSRLGILLSGRGSNFLAIAENIAQGKLRGCEIAVVISNKADAPGLDAARERGLKAVAIEARGRKRAEHDAEITACLRDHKVDLMVVRDSRQSANALYGTFKFPETYVIDKDGVIRRKFIGATDWTNPEIVDYLNKL